MHLFFVLKEAQKQGISIQFKPVFKTYSSAWGRLSDLLPSSHGFQKCLPISPLHYKCFLLMLNVSVIAILPEPISMEY